MRPLYKAILLLAITGLLIGVFLGLRTPDAYPLAECERLDLFYDRKPIHGIEDMAYNAQSGLIYLSAYNRKSSAPGGIYSLSPDNPMQTIEKLSLPQTDKAEYWPHGINLWHSKGWAQLDVIERDLSESGKLAAQISHYIWPNEDPHEIGLKDRIKAPQLCSANNLSSGLIIPDTQAPSYYITQDHQSCDLNQQRWENIFKPRSSSLLHIKQGQPVEIIKEKLAFANGILMHPNGDVYIAETRSKRLGVYEIGARTKINILSSIELPGGPDNLTLSENGTIIAALHPHLIRFAAFRAGWGPRVKSRFAAISKDKTARTYDVSTYDVSKDVISGATVALRAKDNIYLGAAFDKGLARCTMPEGTL